MQEVVLFIPRILPNVSKKQLVDRFAELHIGRVTHIHSKYRVNEKKNEYWFAFIRITPWNTEEGYRFWNQVVVCKETIPLEYFEKGVSKYLYWEIQLCSRNNDHLRKVKTMPMYEENKKEVQVQQVQVQEKKLVRIELEEGEIEEIEEIDESHFTTRDHLEMYQDYLILEREIFGSNYLCKLY